MVFRTLNTCNYAVELQMPLTLPYRGEDERDPCRKAIGLFSEIENNFKKKKKKRKGK